jgi:hypothetical protein
MRRVDLDGGQAAQPSAAATRPMAIVWPAARIEANACQGADATRASLPHAGRRQLVR